MGASRASHGSQQGITLCRASCVLIAPGHTVTVLMAPGHTVTVLIAAGHTVTLLLLLPPRRPARYQNGLHEAIEAKEGLPVQRENRVVATITFQIFFGMYKKLAGMTVRRLRRQGHGCCQRLLAGRVLCACGMMAGSRGLAYA
jgi:hypothetical protein